MILSNINDSTIQKLLESCWVPPRVSTGTELYTSWFLAFSSLYILAGKPKLFISPHKRFIKRKVPLLSLTTLTHLHLLPLVPSKGVKHQYWWIALNLLTLSITSHSLYKKMDFPRKKKIKRGRLQRGRAVQFVGVVQLSPRPEGNTHHLRRTFQRHPTYCRAIAKHVPFFCRWPICEGLEAAPRVRYCWQTATRKDFPSSTSEAVGCSILMAFIPYKSRIIPLRLSVATQILQHFYTPYSNNCFYYQF